MEAESGQTIGHGNLSRREKVRDDNGHIVKQHQQQLQQAPQQEHQQHAQQKVDAITDETTGWPSGSSSYELLSRIGRGAFATVYLAKVRTSGATCAVKVLDLESVDANFIDIRLEVQTMRLSQHPNVLACYTNFVKGTELWLVTQLMNRGSSLRCLEGVRKVRKTRRKQRQLHREVETAMDGNPTSGESLDLCLEDYITYILAETLKGLDYIHSNGQIHRDVKAGNILLDSMGAVRIADFGVSGWLVHGGARRESTRTFVGTPCWMSPEVMEQIEGYNEKSDIWSLGITALELAKGHAPYSKFAPIKVLLLTIQEDPPSLDTYDDDESVDSDDSFTGAKQVI